MGFFKGANTFEVGKLKLGSTNIDRIYFGSNYVWPPIILNSCAIEGTAQGITPLYSCAIEGTAQASIPLFSCAIEGNAVVDNTIVIDGLTYKIVTNPITGRTWLDRNLGATEVAQDVDSIAAQGWLYQWGRLTDGHQTLDSSNISNAISNTDVPATSDFILTRSTDNYDWRSPQNNNLWQGVNGINNPGINGFRLPTEQEWLDEIATWGTQNTDGGFNSILKLPKTKYRTPDFGVITEDGGAYYATSDTSVFNFIAMNIYSAGANSNSLPRARGTAVRLILD